MNNQEFKKVWWPLIWALFALSCIPFLYKGKKIGNKKWIVYGIIHLVIVVVLCALGSQYESANWYSILWLIYGVCGIIHTYVNLETFSIKE